MLAVNTSEHMIVSLGLLEPVAACAVAQLERVAEWDILHAHPGSVHDDHLLARVQYAAILALGNLALLVDEEQARGIAQHLQRAVESHSMVAAQAHRENNPNAPDTVVHFEAGTVLINTTEINLQRHHAVLLDALSNTGNLSDPNVFLDHLRHPEHHHPLVRESATFGLRHHHNDDVEQVLAAHALRDPHPIVRRSAIHAYESQPRSFNLTHVGEALKVRRDTQATNASLYANVSTNDALLGHLEQHELNPSMMHSRARRGLIPDSWLKKLEFLEFDIRLPGFSFSRNVGASFLGASIGAVASNFATLSVRALGVNALSC
jgi:hypothetical protein